MDVWMRCDCDCRRGFLYMRCEDESNGFGMMGRELRENVQERGDERKREERKREREGDGGGTCIYKPVFVFEGYPLSRRMDVMQKTVSKV